ncbi:MAG: hypothetical protein IKB79_04915 [Oscillospiraceae bacterium]|nr:hypothetical protein [Oscillospiraceae bacterium]
MKKLLKTVNDLLPTGLLVLGAAAVSVGIGMFCLPAGVIAAGGMAVAGGVLMMLGRRSEQG